MVEYISYDLYQVKCIVLDLSLQEETTHMAPKKKFTKDQIIDAAFEIARVEGVNSITIRKVAEKLGGSIAPIYVNFKEIGEICLKVYMRKPLK